MVRWTTITALALVAGLAGEAEARRLPPRPLVERIEPTNGPPGTQVQIIGRGFGRVRGVLLGGEPLRVLRRLPNRWTVVVPAGAASGPIVLRTARGDFQGPYFRVTAARPAPQLTSVEPPAGPPGSEVVLRGANFAPRLSDNLVFLGDRPAVVRAATPTTLRVVVPVGARSGPFTVRVVRAGEALSPPFEVTAATAITRVDPPAAPAGAVVTIHGTGFSARARDNRVYLNNRRLRVLRATPTELTVRLPRRVATGPLLVDVRGGGRATSARPFEVQQLPRVRDFAPAGGPAGTVVAIHGSNFGADASAVGVTLDGQPVSVRRVVPDEIEVEIPPGAHSGFFEVRVHRLSVRAPRRFAVTAPLLIEGFEPRSGAPGTIVSIRGQGFSPRPADSAVSLSSVPCEVVSSTPRELRVRIPAAPSGPLVVRTPSTSVQTRQPFVVTNPPFIAAFEPRSGPVGTVVTIRGTNFGDRPGLVRAELHGVPLPVQSVSDRQLQVVIPRGARSGRISVTVGMRGGTVTPEDFVVEAHRQVTSMTPVRGFVGTTVTIRGQGFPRAGTLVQFNGTAPVRAERVSPVELRVLVPAGARTGPVTVLLPGGRAMPAGSFEVTPTPAGTAIAQVHPQCAYPGCRVTLVGHGFSPNRRFNRVRFNGRPVPVMAATPTSLTITLPNAPGNGRFEVRVRRGGNAQSPPFMILPRP